jgi:hypothetical protein
MEVNDLVKNVEIVYKIGETKIEAIFRVRHDISPCGKIAGAQNFNNSPTFDYGKLIFIGIQSVFSEFDGQHIYVLIRQQNLRQESDLNGKNS